MINILNSVSFLNKENYYKKSSSLFRVLICGVLLLDFIFHLDSVNIFYSNDSWFVSYSQSPFSTMIRDYNYVFFITYFGFLILYLLGIGRNFVAIIVCLLVCVKQSVTPEVMNWSDNILRITLFLMIFVNSYDYLKYPKYKKSFLNIDNSILNLISNLAVYMIILNIFLIYFDNGFSKLFTRDWQNGQAFYFSVKHVWLEGTSFNNILADNIYISAIATYGTLFCQFFFIPLVFFKKTKNIIVLITIIFHVILAVFFDIYKFQAILISLHLFLYTDIEISSKKFLNKIFD